MLQERPQSERIGLARALCQTDLYFLLRYVCKRADVEHPWVFARCREVGEFPNGRLDLWSRGHYKSTIVTFGLTIRDILNDPDITVGIFSHTRPIAKGFLRQIKRELQSNDTLKALFPDILWGNPQKESPKWSEDEGIIVRRKSNPKESTVEAWGLVDGQPTSKHFRLQVYDDVVVRDSVTTPEMIAKTTESWELSRNLTADGGNARYAGTRWHFNDSYRTIMDRRAAIPRIYPATVDGTVDGEPVLLTREQLADKRREMGPYSFSSQLMMNPIADEAQGFKSDWIQYYKQTESASSFNSYILVDPANSKKRSSDYTSMWVVGLGQDDNYYVLDIIRDRLNLTERADALFSLHKRWKPRGVGYEQYGMQSDIQHIQDRQARENYRFAITELGGRLSKPDRIRQLIPLFETGRVYMPESVFRTDYEGKVVELVQSFIEEEFKPFPVGLHDDMLDALARILDDDLNVTWPKLVTEDRYRRPIRKAANTSWMSA